MATLNLELGNSKRKDGRYNVVLRITCRKKHKRRALDIFVKKTEFNKKAAYGSWIRVSNPKHHIYNNEIKNRVEKIEERIFELEQQYDDLTIDVISREISKSKQRSFIDYYKSEIYNYRYQKKVRTADKHKYILDKFVKFLGNRDLQFSEFTSELLKKYHSYLADVLGNQINTIHTDLKGMKTIFNSAIRDRLIDPSETPFLNYKISTERTYKEKLTEDEIGKIVKLEYKPGSSLWNTRNIFLFAYYSGGMRFSDLATLRWSNVRDSVLKYKMAKSNKLVNLKLPNQAKEILNHYSKEGMLFNELVFPILDKKYDYSNVEFLKKKISSKNAIINDRLKTIQVDAEIDKNLSTHIARHSFAFNSYKRTRDIDTLRNILQHSSLEETKNYLSDLGIDAKDKFIDEVFG